MPSLGHGQLLTRLGLLQVGAVPGLGSYFIYQASADLLPEWSQSIALSTYCPEKYLVCGRYCLPVSKLCLVDWMQKFSLFKVDLAFLNCATQPTFE